MHLGILSLGLHQTRPTIKLTGQNQRILVNCVNHSLFPTNQNPNTSKSYTATESAMTNLKKAKARKKQAISSHYLAY